MGKALGSSKITVRFQVTVPEEVRNKLKIKEGDNLVFVEDGKKIYISTEF
ncbi:MAG: type II toxin-antitoxin system PrlF family antitoxin [Nitrosopumilus sp.]|nr:type II toxin-antitoxin system PrlF family antitoxin [Nitrosopumilus sp.]